MEMLALERAALGPAKRWESKDLRRKPTVDRQNLGFLLAKASQRWNELLGARFRQAGYPEVSPAFGSILLPLFEEDGLRITDLGQRAGLSKETMTTMIRLMEDRGLVEQVRPA